MAIFPTFVISYKANPANERAPQTKSNLLNFHSACLFTKDARKTSKGTNPTMKVVKACTPTPCLISAKKAIKGAID